MGNELSDKEVADLKATKWWTQEDYITLIARDPEMQKQWIENFRVIVCGDDPSPAKIQSYKQTIELQHPGSSETVDQFIADLRNSPGWIERFRFESKASGLNLSCGPVPMSSNYQSLPVVADASPGAKQRG